MGFFPKRHESFGRFEKMGEDGVRLWLKHPPESISIRSRIERLHAVEWLTKFDYAARIRNESSQSESLDIARSAKDAAWDAATAARDAAREAKTANIIATLALIAALIAIAVAIAALFVRG